MHRLDLQLEGGVVWCQLLGKSIPQIAPQYCLHLLGLIGAQSVENDQLAVMICDHSVEANGVGHVALLVQ